MSEFLRDLSSRPLVVAARARDEKEFFGQCWSHYPETFQHATAGVDFCLSMWNTPNHRQINWGLRDQGTDHGDYADGVWLTFALTPEESRALAAEIGLPITDWLDAALAACRQDVTPDAVARAGNVVDLPTFHASRAGDD